MQELVLNTDMLYHFVGIGGIGMSALAKILLSRGYRVSGTDSKYNPLMDDLAAAGATVSAPHNPNMITAGCTLIVSDAIKKNNPELLRAQELQLPIFSRAELMGAIVNAGHGLAVSGTHGKTTTSGMLSLILLRAGSDPTCVLGGVLKDMGSNARAGGELTVVEACEAYNSFLSLRPFASIVTNIEVDHLDFHGTPQHLFDSFRSFLTSTTGFAVLNGDDAHCLTMLDNAPRTILFGTGENADYRITDIQLSAETSYTLVTPTGKKIKIALQVPGIHNIYNSAAAAAMALEIGTPATAVVQGLADFTGMGRRFDRLGNINGIAIVDDYAHHPTEVKAALAAARASFDGKIIAVFQPHLFSRTRDQAADFAKSFNDADLLVLIPIYPAREEQMPGITSAWLGELVAAAGGPPVVVAESLEDGYQMLLNAAKGIEGKLPVLRSNDLVITIGAGDVDSIAHQLAGYEKETE
ncbi:MAG: UDP-N-acetylmuramate--L-alanine ligase [bacterium]